MRFIQRLPEPQILIERKKQWLDAFLASGNKRPDSSKYAHESIRLELNSMSYYKCFYCETQLKDVSQEVDHYIEVSVDKSRAFEWTNLYLSCQHCNKKIPYNTIGFQNALNPCEDTDEKIQAHLTFEDEYILPKHNSDIGLNTIKKYRLADPVLDYKRVKYLRLLDKLLILREKDSFTQAEIEKIQEFKRKDKPYSLMFKVLLEKLGF